MDDYRSYNYRPLLINPFYIIFGLAISALVCIYIVPPMWDMVAGIWNPLADAANMVTKEGCELDWMPTPRVMDPSPLGIIDAYANQTDGQYTRICTAITLIIVTYAVFLSVRRYNRHMDGTAGGSSPSSMGNTYGSSHLLCKKRDVNKLTKSWKSGRMPKGGNIVLGSRGPNEMLLADCVHGCILGRSGDGKTRRVIIPTIMANLLQGRSVVVNDEKGEIGAMLSPWVAEHVDCRVMKLRLDNPLMSQVRYDPMGRAKRLAMAGQVNEATRELKELARSVVPSLAGTDNDFFVEGARKVFVGVALYVLTCPNIPDECRNLSSVYATIMPTAKDGVLGRLEELRKTLAEDDPALTFLGAVAGERGGGPGIVGTLSSALIDYIDSDIDVIMHDDEVELDRIGERQTLLLMSSSNATGGRTALKNTLFSQTLSALRTCAQRHGGTCPVPTVLVMDEFASLGRCERLLGDLGVIRSEGITVITCWQSLTQLESVSRYSTQEAKTLLDQLQHKVILSCGDYETALELSRTIGDYTCDAEGSSKSKNANGGSTFGTSQSLTGRPVITPDELTRWSAKDNGVLVITPKGTLALESRDISDTFCGRDAGLVDPNAPRKLRDLEEHYSVPRNRTHPRVWRGPRVGVGASKDEASARTVDELPENLGPIHHWDEDPTKDLKHRSDGPDMSDLLRTGYDEACKKLLKHVDEFGSRRQDDESGGTYMPEGLDYIW